MADSKSGLNKEQRAKILRANGFELLHWGKGDHAIWENAELKALAKTQKIVAPPNLLSNPAQKAWESTVPMDPATGTWHRIVKHTEWAKETVDKFKGASAEAERKRKIVSDFREAREEITTWKHESKHRLKAGLQAKPAPQSYHQLNQIKARYDSTRGGPK